MHYRATCLLLTSALFAVAAEAAPSGGPYGPVDQNYAIPKAPHVYYVAPDGKADAAGTSLAAPTSIEAAVQKAVTGDAIVLRGGVYRTGNLTFNQKIVFQPYGTERPVLKGTEVATNWQKAGENAWKTSWTKLFPAQPEQLPVRGPARPPQQMRTVHDSAQGMGYQGNREPVPGAAATGPGEAPQRPAKPAPIHVGDKVGRNDPCPCGSGKKYKHCHGR